MMKILDLFAAPANVGRTVENISVTVEGENTDEI